MVKISYFFWWPQMAACGQRSPNLQRYHGTYNWYNMNHSKLTISLNTFSQKLGPSIFSISVVNLVFGMQDKKNKNVSVLLLELMVSDQKYKLIKNASRYSHTAWVRPFFSLDDNLNRQKGQPAVCKAQVELQFEGQTVEPSLSLNSCGQKVSEWIRVTKMKITK